MPPKPKFTREKITEAALNIIRTRGAESLTARELGKALGSSPCPIFTLFAFMVYITLLTSGTASLRQNPNPK